MIASLKCHCHSQPRLHYDSIMTQLSIQQLTRSIELLGTIMLRHCWKCFIGWECLKVSSPVQALCTRVQVSEWQWTGLPRWQSTLSDGLSAVFIWVTDVQSRRCLRSSSSSLLIIQVTYRATLSDHVFPVTAARAWNGLPDCHISTFLCIIPCLDKTYLFSGTFWHWQHASIILLSVQGKYLHV